MPVVLRLSRHLIRLHYIPQRVIVAVVEQVYLIVFHNLSEILVEVGVKAWIS